MENTATALQLDTPLPVASKLPALPDNAHRSVFVPVVIDYASKSTLKLSLKEKLACDVYVRTQSFAACARAIREKFGVVVQPESIRKWIQSRDHVKGYVTRHLEDLGFFNNWTRERWIRAVEAHAQGMREISFGDGQVFVFDKGAHFRLKLLGEALGYMSDAAQNKGLQNNIQINFTQSDGRE